MEVLQPGNVLVVSGGASGIGLAVARSCVLQHHMHVALLDLDQRALDAAVADLRSAAADGVRVLPCPCDGE